MLFSLPSSYPKLTVCQISDEDDVDPASAQLRAEAGNKSTTLSEHSGAHLPRLDNSARRISASLSALAATAAESAALLKMPRRSRRTAVKTVQTVRAPTKRKRESLTTAPRTSLAKRPRKSTRRGFNDNSDEDIDARQLAAAKNVEGDDDGLEEVAAAAVKAWGPPESSEPTRRATGDGGRAGQTEAVHLSPAKHGHIQPGHARSETPLFVDQDGDEGMAKEQPALTVRRRGRPRKSHALSDNVEDQAIPKNAPAVEKRGQSTKSPHLSSSIQDNTRNGRVPAVMATERPDRSTHSLPHRRFAATTSRRGRPTKESMPNQGRTGSNSRFQVRKPVRTLPIGKNDIFEPQHSDPEVEADDGAAQDKRPVEEEDSDDADEEEDEEDADDGSDDDHDDILLSDIPETSITEWRKLSPSDFNSIYQSSRKFQRHLNKNNHHRSRDKISNPIQAFKQGCRRLTQEITGPILEQDYDPVTPTTYWNRVDKAFDTLRRTFWGTMLGGSAALAQQFYEQLFLDLIALFYASSRLYTCMDDDGARIKSLELILSVSTFIHEFCERVRRWKVKVDTDLAIVKPARQICKMVRDLGPLIRSEIKAVQNDMLRERRRLQVLRDEQMIEGERARHIKQREHDMKMNRLNYFLTERYKIQSYDRSMATNKFQPRFQQPPSSSRFAVDANGDPYEREDVFTARRPGSTAPGKELNIPAIKWELAESLILIDAVVKFHSKRPSRRTYDWTRECVNSSLDQPMMWKAIMEEYCGFRGPLTHRTFLELLFEAKRLQRVYEYTVATTGAPSGKLSYFEELQDLDLYDLYYP